MPIRTDRRRLNFRLKWNVKKSINTAAAANALVWIILFWRSRNTSITRGHTRFTHSHTQTYKIGQPKTAKKCPTRQFKQTMRSNWNFFFEKTQQHSIAAATVCISILVWLRIFLLFCLSFTSVVCVLVFARVCCLFCVHVPPLLVCEKCV